MEYNNTGHVGDLRIYRYFQVRTIPVLGDATPNITEH